MIKFWCTALFTHTHTRALTHIKCEFWSKGIQVARFALFEVIGVPRFRSVQSGYAQKSTKKRWYYRVGNFSVFWFSWLVKLCYKAYSHHMIFRLPCSPQAWKCQCRHESVKADLSACTVSSWSSFTLPLIERNWMTAFCRWGVTLFSYLSIW